MSDSSKSGSFEAYRQHGDRHDLAEAAEKAWETLCDYRPVFRALVGALAVAVRDGVLEADAADEVREAFEPPDFKRVRAAMEVLDDELRGGA